MDALVYSRPGLRDGEGLAVAAFWRYHSVVMASHESEMARLLDAWNEGDEEALERLMPLVIDDLRSIARRYFRREDPGHTLQPTALVNELYLRLAGQKAVHWKSASHFFGTAAQMMRRLLVDHARRHQTAKRGGDAVKLPLDEDLPYLHRHDPEEILALEDALNRLGALEPRQSQVVSLKFFAGLTNAEIAKTLGVGLTAVKSDLRIARAWLIRELRGEAPGASASLPKP